MTSPPLNPTKSTWTIDGQSEKTTWYASLPRRTTQLVRPENMPEFNPLGTVNAYFSGAATLTAETEMEYIPFMAPFGGSGALSAAITTVSGASAPFSSDASLTGKVVPGNKVTLSSTGTLAATLDQVVTTAAAPFAGAGTAGVLHSAGFSGMVGGLNGQGTLSATVSTVAPVAPKFTGSGALTAVRGPRHEIPVFFVGGGSLSVDLVQGKQAEADFTGSGALTAQMISGGVVTAPFNSEGLLAPTAMSIRASAAPAFGGNGSLSAVARVRHTAALFGSGELISIGGATASAPFSGTGVLSADYVAGAAVTANFFGTGDLSAVQFPYASVQAAFSGSGALSADSLVRFSRTAALDGSGTLSALVYDSESGTFPAFAGEGALTADASAVAPVAVSLSGSGALSANTLEVERESAGFSGLGALSAAQQPRTSYSPALSGSGSLSATQQPRPAFAVELSGSGTLASTTQVGLGADLAGSGTLSALVSVVTLSARGMDKSGTQSLNSSSTYTKITGWAPQANSTTDDIVNNDLIVNGAGQIRVLYKIIGNAGYSPAMTAQLRVNGTTASTGSAGTTSSSGSHVYTAAAGDALSLWGNPGQWASSFPFTVAEGNANTVVEYSPLVAGTFYDVGMTKSGTYTISASSTWEKLTGWVDSSLYPGSTIVNNELVMPGPATVNPSVLITSSNTVQVRLVKTGGTVLATSSLTTNPSVSASAVSVVEGDVIWVEVYKNTTLSRTVSAGNVYVTD